VTVNKERVQLLVDALRSGEYRQAQGSLRRRVLGADYTDYTDYTYCCLGVATKVALRHGLSLEEGEAFSGTCMDSKVQAWFGFSTGNPGFPENPYSSCTLPNCTEIHAADAVYANDARRFDFDQIADLFEANYITQDAEVTA
jgi:hypothetical protein